MRYAYASICLGVIGFAVTIAGFVLSSVRNKIFAVIFCFLSAGICFASIIIGALAVADAENIWNAFASSYLLTMTGDLAVGTYLVYTSGINLLIYGLLYIFIWAGSIVYILDHPDY